jgi:hypothetical protein
MGTHVPVAVDVETWQAAVDRVLAPVDALTPPQLDVAVAWCCHRQAMIDSLGYAQSVTTALTPGWHRRYAEAHRRITVVRRWQSGHPDRRRDQGTALGFEAAVRKALVAVFAPTTDEWPGLGHSYPAALQLAASAPTDPLLHDIVLGLAPTWFGTVDELVDAARLLAR